MKSFLTIFYTRPAKTVYLAIILILSLFVGECQMKYFEYMSSDKASFINAISQLDSYKYETSYYFRNTVNNAVNGVVKLSMDYTEVFEQDKTEEELLSFYDSIGDRSFLQIIEQLKEIEGFSFAVLNHDNNIIYSNIEEINCADSVTEIRKYFGDSGKNLLIARNCKNPYFATNSFIDFAEMIRDSAAEYDADFDLYIRFGSTEQFDATAEKCRQLHFEMREKIEELNNTIAVYVAVIAVIALVMLVVTGKHEPKGKTYLTPINRIPNDLIVIIYSIVLTCIVDLYRTSVSVVINYGMELDALWFMRSEDFYISRIKYCVIIFICVTVNLSCVLKRAYKTGTLLTNTYVYPVFVNLKTHLSKNKPKEMENTNENK